MKIGSIDIMFSSLTTGVPTWATTIAGFVLVLMVIFLGVVMFGKSKQQLNAYGISVLTFIGIVLASLLGLFPFYVIVIFLVLSLVTILLSIIFGGQK